MKIEMQVSFIKVVKQILINMLARLQRTGRQIAKMDCFVGITCPHLVKLFTQQILNLGWVNNFLLFSGAKAEYALSRNYTLNFDLYQASDVH